MKTHRYRKHKHYSRWADINARCTNPQRKQFSDYGGRGIAVHPEWRREAGPKAFCDWIDENLGPCPVGMTLDRIDNDKGYAPGNLRWATRSQQQNNQRDKRRSTNAVLPRGVYPSGKRFYSKIKTVGGVVCLGSYDTPEEASEMFQFAKRQKRIYEEEFLGGTE